MADARTVVTGISLTLALVCAGWAVYVIKHKPAAGGPPAQARQGGPAGGGGGGFGGQGGAPVPVITAAVTRRSINIGIEAIGTANSNEAVSVSSKTSNIVTAIHFSDGQAVNAGQILVELDRDQTAADLAAATAAFEESRSQFNRSRELVATQALSKAQYEQLEATMKANEARVAAARSRLSDTYIRAPFAGRVGLRRVSLGALISPGTVITTLDDTSAIKVDFAVPELNVGNLRAGQAVQARTVAYPGRKFTGRVISVDSRVDPATRAVTVRAVVPNGDAALKPGMFLTVELAQDNRPGLVVPEEALVPEQARQFVYVVDGAVVRKREVSLGRREPGFVEITNGLEAGNRVVVEGTLKLREGAAIREMGTTAPSAVPGTASGAAPAAMPAPARPLAAPAS